MDAEIIRIENELSSDSLEKSSERNIEKLEMINSKIKRKEIEIEFLHDLKDFQDFFQSKRINAEIQDISFEFSKLLYQNLKSRILEIAYKKVIDQLKTNINNRPSKVEIISEIIKDEFSNDIYQDNFKTNNLQKLVTSVILKHFGYKYDESEVAALWSQEIKSKKLEQFERKMGKRIVKPIEIPNFSSLSGEEFEIFLSSLFEKLGYNVNLTRRTKDQGADLVITKNNQRTVVQAKCYSSPVGNGAIQEIVAAKPLYRADKAIVITNSTFTPSAIELSQANNVELWDGEILIRNIQKTNDILTKRSIEGK